MTDDPTPPGGQYGQLCQVCDREKMLTPSEANAAYPSFPWGDREICESADKVCPFCKAAYFSHGKRLKSERTAYWVRTVTAIERAYQLYQAYDRKSREECKEKITAGNVHPALPSEVRR